MSAKIERKFDEIGSSGLKEMAGWIQEAYRHELTWPGVEPEFSRIWRSDTEVTITRNIYGSWAASLTPRFELPASSEIGEDIEPTDDDKRALDFANQALVDIEGGISKWFVSAMERVPYYGWGVWEAPPGVRSQSWTPPQNDPWRSKYNDGLIGFRRLAFRRYSSFYGWEFDDYERLSGMKQLTTKGGIDTIPIERCLHVTFGDSDNPEGLATLEAMWRLAQIKRGLEVVFGIGSEHTAGHLSVTVEDEKSFDIDNIRAAAQNMMSAQEGNYAAWPAGVNGEIIDVPFAAGATILDAIRHYTILKLALLGMQWVAFSTISGVGSMASMKDASQIAVGIFNTKADGLVNQADQQIGARLFEYDVNKAAFPGMTRRPRLVIDALRKETSLDELGSFATAMKAIMPMSEADYVAIRSASEILPDSMPRAEEIESVSDDSDNDTAADSDTDAIEPDEAAELIERVMWVVQEHDPDLYNQLDNSVADSDDCDGC